MDINITSCILRVSQGNGDGLGRSAVVHNIILSVLLDCQILRHIGRLSVILQGQRKVCQCNLLRLSIRAESHPHLVFGHAAAATAAGAYTEGTDVGVGIDAFVYMQGLVRVVPRDRRPADLDVVGIGSSRTADDEPRGAAVSLDGQHTAGTLDDAGGVVTGRCLIVKIQIAAVIIQVRGVVQTDEVNAFHKRLA